MRCTTPELHAMDFCAHTHLLEEWNDASQFTWGSATVLYDFPFSTVVHEVTIDGQRSMAVAVYRTDAEGQLTSLRMYDRRGDASQHDLVTAWGNIMPGAS